MKCCERPLVVDLDRTLITEDSFWSDTKFLIKHQALGFCYEGIKILFFHKGKGRWPFLKSRVAFLSGEIDYKINPEFFKFLQSEHKQRKCWLFTGSAAQNAFYISQKHQYFSKILASTNKTIMSASQKLIWLRENKINEFDYAGDKLGDFIIFKKSAICYVVNPSLALLLRLLLASKFKIKFFDVAINLKWLSHLVIRRHSKIKEH
ncbi:MAG: hypothetical protein JJV97_05760 [SAR324 cluster bacterium]|nr:hypothetical protein [SAR324 cluster bacterium]